MTPQNRVNIERDDDPAPPPNTGERARGTTANIHTSEDPPASPNYAPKKTSDAKPTLFAVLAREVLEQLDAAPLLIVDAQGKLARALMDYQDADARVSLAEDRALLDVASDIGPTTIKPKYTTESTRQAAANVLARNRDGEAYEVRAACANALELARALVELETNRFTSAHDQSKLLVALLNAGVKPDGQ